VRAAGGAGRLEALRGRLEHGEHDAVGRALEELGVLDERLDHDAPEPIGGRLVRQQVDEGLRPGVERQDRRALLDLVDDRERGCGAPSALLLLPLRDEPADAGLRGRVDRREGIDLVDVERLGLEQAAVSRPPGPSSRSSRCPSSPAT
jgi:hypothetical protein